MPNETKEELVEGVRPFSHFLEMLDDGQFHWDLSAELRDLCAELSQTAADTGKAKGRITLTIDLSMEGYNLVATPKLASKKPDKPQAKTYLWLTEGNNPTPNNPRQQRFQFGPREVDLNTARVVPEAPRKVREVK